ncbi:1-aminocyclopropane-1-carboxylate oxidase homolog 3-like [Dioscorea cayenensis subsp. rotundata]|uniref:1-aminocyclopropane-1-carboxylate oxidase homolog 3-like n=1 Tax=Dioscorea cayennensis subsp. rotundata TaxID=55577 RepID=A0AB40CZ88_DIOCR|nr:1-aminocyclopropane-1-carboxylate oxidase homolog 3-like [Dioscorea cayenensis subsp. rotundata]
MSVSIDRAIAVKAFDETKAGVKGLVDSGITSVPFIFHHPTANLSLPVAAHLSIPTVDLSLPRPITIDRIRSASRDWGFFQLINHSIPISTMQSTISAVRAFHELPTAVRSKHYTRSPVGGVAYLSNGDLFKSSAASWRDTLQISFGPTPPELDDIPEVCRSELVKWDESAKEVAREVMSLMCEGLGLGPRSLEELSCLEGRGMSCHYYPPCPEPNLTVGAGNHTDPVILTVLLQDEIGGLRAKRKVEDGHEVWVDVKPIPGALVVNVGDLLQIFTNDEFKSVHHQVVANSSDVARVSVACFFNPGRREESTTYGPLPELLSSENPPRYRNFTVNDFLGRFLSKELNTKTLIEFFKL